MTVIDRPARILQVRVFTGRVSHLLDTIAPRLPEVDIERAPALCNYRPVWPGAWIEDADSAVCLTCIKIKEANFGDRTA